MSLSVYLYPGPNETGDCLYSANITHNLNKMASEAGLYAALWRPDENGFTKAKDITAILTAGLTLLIIDPSRFNAFNPSNGWGNRDNLVEFVTRYLEACRLNPEAYISVSR